MDIPIARPATTSKRAIAGIDGGLYREGLVVVLTEPACSNPSSSVGRATLWHGCV